MVSTMSVPAPATDGRMSSEARETPSISPSEESWGLDLDDVDLAILQRARDDSDGQIVERAVRKPERLGYFSILCLIFNRMIGTGIFNSANIVFSNTQSIGVSLLLWFYGAIVALCGVFVYIELGLTIPRWSVGHGGSKVSTPKSGGELNYVRLQWSPIPKCIQESPSDLA
jgi:hypothetical protein